VQKHTRNSSLYVFTVCWFCNPGSSVRNLGTLVQKFMNVCCKLSSSMQRLFVMFRLYFGHGLYCIRDLEVNDIICVVTWYCNSP